MRLARLVSTDEARILDALNGLVSSGRLLQAEAPQESFELGSESAREEVVRAIDPLRRRELQGRVAVALEADAPDPDRPNEELGYHHREAGQVSHALRHLKLSVRKALEAARLS